MQHYFKISFVSIVFLVMVSCGQSRSSKLNPAGSHTEVVSEQSLLQTPDLVSSTDTTIPTEAHPTRKAPTQGLKASGPIVFSGDSGIWLTDAFGRSPVQLWVHENRLDLRRAISPNGDRIALLERTEEGLDLLIVQIPTGEKERIAQVIALPHEEANPDLTTPKAFATNAIRDYGSIAWQPGDGRLLAFIAATEGPTADLFLYDTQTKEISRLTDGPSQAVLPIFSPDGRFILHFGVSWVPPFGGAIGGHNQLDGVWAVDVSNGEIITLPKPESVAPHFVGWQDDSHYITFDSSEDCGAENLRSIEAATGESTPLMEQNFAYYIDFSPETDTLLISGDGECPNSLEERAYLLSLKENSLERVVDERIWGIEWLPESLVFQAYPEALLSPDGETLYTPPVYDHSFNPAISAVGFEAWEVIEDQKGRVEVRVPGGDWQSIFEGSVDVLIWDPITGENLMIVRRDGSLYTVSYPDFTTFKQGDLGGRVNQAVWLP